MRYLLINDEVLLAVGGNAAAFVAEPVVLDGDALADPALEPLALPAAGEPARPCRHRTARCGVRLGPFGSAESCFRWG